MSDERLKQINEMQDFLEHLAHEHEKLRQRCEIDPSDAFLNIVISLDNALRASISQTGALAEIFFSLTKPLPLDKSECEATIPRPRPPPF